MPSMYDIHTDAGVPILGQALKLVSTTMVSMYACQCSAGDPLTFVLQMVDGGLKTLPAQCPRCLVTYSISGIKMERNGFAFAFTTQPPSSDAV